MLFYMNETNLEQKEVRQCKKRQKKHESLQGDGEWARKSLFEEFLLLFDIKISIK